MNAVIVDSMSAARFHMTNTTLVASSHAPIADARRPPTAPSPAASAAMARRPDARGTVRACHVPTPKSRNAAYSIPVNTGVTKTGFQLSVRQWPHMARFRAL